MKMSTYSIPHLSLIGELGKVHGTRGELSAYLTIDAEELLVPLQSFVFIDIDGLPVPYLLKSIRTKGQDTYLLLFKSIESIAEAQERVGAKLYLPTDLISEDNVSFTWQHFIGFSLLDVEGQILGEIVDVNDMTENVLLSISSQEGKEYLIPVHEDLIEDIDIHQKTLSVQIPEGILDL